MPPPEQVRTDSTAFRAGIAYAIGAYCWWGCAPLYFKLIAHVAPTLVLAHRILWSALLLAALVASRRQWREVQAGLSSRRTLGWLLVSTLLVAANWLIFIYAVAADRVVEASLGYFINPLFTVLLGTIFLRERLRPAPWAAAALAGAALAYLSLTRAGLPWIALALPLSFGFYSLIRKQLPIGPVPGLLIETLLLAPAAVPYLAWAHASPDADAANTLPTLVLLALSGVVTALPLLWFVAAAQRLPLTTIGFLQYLNPTMQFLTAVVLFGEPFDRDRLIAFTLIWAAVGIFLADLVRATRPRR